MEFGRLVYTCGTSITKNSRAYNYQNDTLAQQLSG